MSRPGALLWAREFLTHFSLVVKRKRGGLSAKLNSFKSDLMYTSYFQRKRNKHEVD